MHFIYVLYLMNTFIIKYMNFNKEKHKYLCVKLFLLFENWYRINKLNKNWYRININKMCISLKI